MAFTRKLIALRKKYPILNPPVPLNGNSRDSDGIKDITWFIPSGEEKQQTHWQDSHARTIGVLFNGAAVNHEKVGNERLFIVFNAHSGAIPFNLPRLPGIKGWERVLDTAAPDLEQGDDKTVYGINSPCQVKEKSLVIFRPVP